VEFIDNTTTQRPGNAFLGAGIREEIGSVELEVGKTYKLLISFGSVPTSKLVKKGIVTFRKGGVRLRGGHRIDASKAIAQAIAVAKRADQVVLVAGLNVGRPSSVFLKQHIQAHAAGFRVIGRLRARTGRTFRSLHTQTSSSAGCWMPNPMP
jgi:beta-glucosidase